MVRLSLAVKPLVLALTVVLATSALCLAQEGRPNRGPRGGFGFGGGGFDTLSKSVLLRAEQVQTELGLSDDQKSKINTIVDESRQQSRELFTGGNFRDLTEEQRRARFTELREKGQKIAEETNQKLGAVLSEAQSKRIDEITLQAQGARALTTDDVAKKLALTDEQTQKIRDVLQAESETRRELFSAGGGRDLSREEREKAFAETRTKMEELRKETEKAVQDVLTDSQKQQLAEMKGKEFNLDRSALFQGFGRGFGGGRPGGDGERRRSSDSNNNNSNNSN
jgi:Spy/CpxP family protein refolding chaperone